MVAEQGLIHSGLIELEAKVVNLTDPEVKDTATKIGHFATNFKNALTNQKDITDKMNDQWQTRMTFMEKLSTIGRAQTVPQRKSTKLTLEGQS